MTVTEYLEILPHELLVSECMELIMENRSHIETFIDRLIARRNDLEEDDSTYSSLIPRMQKKFDDAFQEAEFMLEYERSLDWSNDE